MRQQFDDFWWIQTDERNSRWNWDPWAENIRDLTELGFEIWLSLSFFFFSWFFYWLQQQWLCLNPRSVGYIHGKSNVNTIRINQFVRGIQPVMKPILFPPGAIGYSKPDGNKQQPDVCYCYCLLWLLLFEFYSAFLASFVHSLIHQPAKVG